MADEVAYNPFDPSFHADPYPHYRDLLAGPPRRLALRVPVVLVARYADVIGGDARSRDVLERDAAVHVFARARSVRRCADYAVLRSSRAHEAAARGRARLQPAADNAARAAYR